MARIQLFHGDITSLKVDAIVNAANESLLGGGGVDGAIHAAAGPQLVAASRVLAPCHAGNARLTPGFQLPARFVVHAVGPVYTDGSQREGAILQQTYRAVLKIALDESFDTLAIPCISTGAYGFPKQAARDIAIETVMDWQDNHRFPATVVFCCFDSLDVEIYTERLDELGILSRY